MALSSFQTDYVDHNNTDHGVVLPAKVLRRIELAEPRRRERSNGRSDLLVDETRDGVLHVKKIKVIYTRTDVMIFHLEWQFHIDQLLQNLRNDSIRPFLKFLRFEKLFLAQNLVDGLEHHYVDFLYVIDIALAPNMHKSALPVRQTSDC